MGIFSRLFQRGEGAPSAEGDDPEIEIGPPSAVEPPPAPAPIAPPEPRMPLAAPLAAPLWSWPQRSAASQEAPVTDDPLPPSSPRRTPLPGLPKAHAPAATPLPSLPRRAKSDSIGQAFDQVVASGPAAAQAAAQDGVSTAEDLAAVRELFHEVAVAHVAQVRDVMLELRYGAADPTWMDAARPALRSLRAMAHEMELDDLCAALDAFCAADANKDTLLERYQQLIDLIPQAFELDAERDRREPIIVHGLLAQVDGVERPTIDKLFAVGLGRLEALLRANVDDLVAVSGIRRELATAIVDQLRRYRADTAATISVRDPVAERRELGDQLIMLSLLNDDFARAAAGWTDEARAKKRALRREREQAYQRIVVTLARLGERDQLVRLEPLAYDERIAHLDRYLSNLTPARPAQP